MGRGRPSLASFGLPTAPVVIDDLTDAGLLARDTGAPKAGADPTLAALGRSGNPELAARTLAEIVTALGAGRGAASAAHLRKELATNPGMRARLVALLGASEPLGRTLVAHPADWTRFTEEADTVDLTDSTQHRAALAAAAGNGGPDSATIAALRTEYQLRLATIAAADLAPSLDPQQPGPTVSEIGHALATLADALLQVALGMAQTVVGDDSSARLSVLAMGKCGGNELNYLSDVDVLFVMPDDAGPGHTVTPSVRPSLETATAVAAELIRICGLVAWEVDPALRPEGRAGQLVRTLGAYQDYWDTWAKTWEFQALLKARPAAGNLPLGEEFLARAAQYVWRAADRDGFVGEVQAMRRRVRDSVPALERPDELKLSSGGLRDVEFAVQLLQLVHGRADETLRVGGTLAAIAALAAGGYIGRRDAAELTDSYTFMRRLEHLAQLQHLRRTHRIPRGDKELGWLARAAGFPLTGTDGTSAALRQAFTTYTSTIRRLHEKLFYRPLLTAVAAVPTEDLRLSASAAASRLAALGFVSPDSALRHISALTRGLSRRAAIQRTLLPVLLEVFSDAPDPDRSLLAYRTVSDALAHTPWYLRLLRDEGSVAERFAGLLGSSALVSELITRAPEVLRELAKPDDLIGPDVARHSRTAAAALHSRADRASTAQAAATAARSARRHEMVRIACADLLGTVGVDDVLHGLTSIADAALIAVLHAAHRQVLARRLEALSTIDSDGDPVQLAARVTLIAVGRLGGYEANYFSDADVLFLAEPSSPDNRAVMTDANEIAEATIELLGAPSPDPALVVDAELRPGGRSGPLVRTVDSYREYWNRHAEPWQRQALLRARPLEPADPAAVRLMAVIDPLRYPDGGLTADEVRQIRRLKARVDDERLPRGADPTVHTKLGRGGLADVEWAVQLLQLRHAARHSELQRTDTLGALRHAAELDLIRADDADTLSEAWRFATRVRNALMLVTGKPADEIPQHGPVLVGVARALGYPPDEDPGEFVDDYRRATRHAHTVVQDILAAD